MKSSHSCGYQVSSVALCFVLLPFAAAPAAAQSSWAIFVMNADGTDAKKVSRVDDRFLGSPSWSRDGKTLLYDGAPPSLDFAQAHIFKQRLDDEKARDLGPGNTPHLSPDDQQIAFSLKNNNAAGARPGVYVMNADGEAREWLCEGWCPRWSPDGERIALFSDHEGFPSLYIFDTTSLQRQRVLPRGYEEFFGARWSPDGKQLVFVGRKSRQTYSQNELAIVDAAADQTPKVVDRGELGWSPDWSPDGTQLLYWRGSLQNNQLHMLDVNAEAAPRLLPGQFGTRNSDAVWSPDGKRIAFSSNRGG